MRIEAFGSEREVSRAGRLALSLAGGFVSLSVSRAGSFSLALSLALGGLTVSPFALRHCSY